VFNWLSKFTTSGNRWRVLSEAGSRLSLSEVAAELAERGCQWDERSIRRHLQRLQAAGLADHDAAARPPGYGVRPRPVE